MDTVNALLFVCALLTLYCLLLSNRISNLPKPTMFQRMDQIPPAPTRVTTSNPFTPSDLEAKCSPQR